MSDPNLYRLRFVELEGLRDDLKTWPAKLPTSFPVKRLRV